MLRNLGSEMECFFWDGMRGLRWKASKIAGDFWLWVVGFGSMEKGEEAEQNGEKWRNGEEQKERE